VNDRLIALGLVIAAMALPSRIRADVAPPNMDACRLLPAGSPCTEDGRSRGECVRIGDAGGHACRVLAKHTRTQPSSVPAASATAGSTHVEAAVPARSNPRACSLSPTSFLNDTKGRREVWILLGVGALFRRRRTRKELLHLLQKVAIKIAKLGAPGSRPFHE